MWWLGVFIAPTTKMTVGEGFCRMAHRTVRCATGHCPVRQPRHQAVGFRPLELLTTGPPDSPVVHRTVRWCTGQSGGAPDSPVVHRTVTVHCPVRHLAPALTSACTVALFTVALQTTVGACSRCSACHTGQSGATPDSPVNYSGAASPNSRRWQVWS
jgi:hypothetical protein